MWWFNRLPLWSLGPIVFALALITYGHHLSLSSDDVVYVASNPWAVDARVDAPWTYSSPLGPVLAWATGMNEWGALHRFHLVLGLLIVTGCTVLVARCVNDTAGRLFPVAFYCSPNSWGAVSLLGLFDIITLGAVTGMFVGGVSVAGVAGVVGGLAHFEQAAVAAVAASIIRVRILEHDLRCVKAMWVGLFAGKAVVVAYTSLLGVDSASRLSFIRAYGVENIVAGWIGNTNTYLWAVFNVLWVGVAWMFLQFDRSQRLTLVATFAVATLPVLLTVDIGRVYRNVTWPIVMLLVVYASQHPDRRLVQRAALVLMTAAVFVPRTEIWQHGLTPWISA